MNAKIAIVLLLGVGSALALTRVQRPDLAAARIMSGKKTVEDRLAQYGDAAHSRLAPFFERAAVSYPPARSTFIGLKAERVLQVWVAGADGKWKHLRDYPILGMSGTLGPKLRQGDLQAPEGIYRVESLNPNSLYHLSLRIDYPNAWDRMRAAGDGRTDPGSDIMIHGNTGSVGCLAMGDEASEDLFVLAAETGIGNITIIISPVDFRARNLPADMPSVPDWTGDLYGRIREALKGFRKPGKTIGEPNP